MPDPRSPSTPGPGERLETYWKERFEAAARLPDDPARNIGRTFGHEARRAAFLELVHRHLPGSIASVLDVGCGSGTYFDLYAQFGWRIQGVDYSPAQLAVARARFPAARLEAGELAAVPPDLTADLVVCIGVVQVISELPAFLAAIAARVHPGGRAVISCLNKHSLWPGSLTDPHLRFYGRSEMRRLLAPHFGEVACLRVYPLPPPFSRLRPLVHRLQVPGLNHAMMFLLEPRSR